MPGIARVDRVKDLAAMAKKGDTIARRWLQSIPADMPAALTITMQPYFYDSAIAFATHGTPYDYDAHIPVIMMGSMFVPGVYDAPVRFRRYRSDARRRSRRQADREGGRQGHRVRVETCHTFHARQEMILKGRRGDGGNNSRADKSQSRLDESTGRSAEDDRPIERGVR